MSEILSCLQKLYSPGITKSALYRSLHALEKSPATAALVRPLDAKRPAQYSAQSACRIARRVTHGLAPDRFTAPAKSAKIGEEKVSETLLELKRDLTGTSH